MLRSVEYSGIWTPPKVPDFHVDRERVSDKAFCLLADKGLVHKFGNEATARFRKGHDDPAKRESIIAQAREDLRTGLYDGSWERGIRMVKGPVGSRLEQIFNREAAKATRKHIKDTMTRMPEPEGVDADEIEETWRHPSGRLFTIDVLVESFLTNPDPDPIEPSLTTGAVRKAKLEELADQLYQAELAQKASLANVVRNAPTGIVLDDGGILKI
jgi:hypothetical protein